MTFGLMNKRTAELMLLLHEDGVDREELKALVGSAFEDGVEFALQHVEDLRARRDR